MGINPEEHEANKEIMALREWLARKGWDEYGSTLTKETESHVHVIDIKRQTKED